jgi:hypothetical protein
MKNPMALLLPFDSPAIGGEPIRRERASPKRRRCLEVKDNSEPVICACLPKRLDSPQEAREALQRLPELLDCVRTFSFSPRKQVGEPANPWTTPRSRLALLPPLAERTHPFGVPKAARRSASLVWL